MSTEILESLVVIVSLIISGVVAYKKISLKIKMLDSKMEKSDLTKEKKKEN